MSVNILGRNYSINETTFLDLSWKKLKEIPHGVFELINLRVLNLSHNELICISIDINKLVNLESLGLSYNELTEINDVNGLVKLTGLWLNNNKLTTIPYVSSLVKLNCLYLVHNELTSISQELCEMKKLVHVDLSNNCIHDDESIKIFNDLSVESKHMRDQKQLKMLPIILPMVII